MTEEKQREYIIDADTLGAMGDYFLAAIRGEENKTRLLELWKGNLSVATSRPYDIDATKAAEQKRIIKKIKSEIKSLARQYEACDFWSESTVKEIVNVLNSVVKKQASKLPEDTEVELSCDSQDGG